MLALLVAFAVFTARRGTLSRYVDFMGKPNA